MAKTIAPMMMRPTADLGAGEFSAAFLICLAAASRIRCGDHDLRRRRERVRGAARRRLRVPAQGRPACWWRPCMPPHTVNRSSRGRYLRVDGENPPRRDPAQTEGAKPDGNRDLGLGELSAQLTASSK